MIVQCPKCGSLVSDKAMICPKCGVPMSTEESKDNQNNSTTNNSESSPKKSEEKVGTQKPSTNQSNTIKDSSLNNQQSRYNDRMTTVTKKSGINPVVLIVILSVMILCVSGFFLYSNVIKPNQIDKAAPRYYTFAPSVMLRSSKNSGVDYNKVASLLYGTELITYNKGVEWSEVKVNLPEIDGKKPKGFVASQFILNKKDFFLLHSIWGDSESKEVIETTKCRRALLNYYKSQHYIGKLSVEEASELSLPYPQPDNQWQVFCLSRNMETNNVYFKRILRKDSKFTDFAVIIKNIVTGERKLLFFYFEDDETPHLAIELDAPAYGTIEKIKLKTIDDKSYLDVTYTE